MVYLYIALYREAKEVIHRLGLKRKQVSIGFDVYEDEKETIRLILTGTGALPAAAAVGSSLSFFCAGAGDMLINFGSCAGDGEKGKVYLCHKLIDRTTGRTYYPDMLFRSDLPEACIVMEPGIWKKNQEKAGILHDMEGAAVFAAGSYFLSPHQMHFLKVVSDDGTETVQESDLSEVAGQAVDALIKYMDILLRYGRERKAGHIADTENTHELERIFEEFHCSQTMRIMLSQYIRYWELAGVDYKTSLDRMREAGELPSRDRREGKERIERLKAELL